MTLVRDIDLQTSSFPRDELYGLAQQMRRSAVSVPSNLAEGQGRLSKKEFIQFLGLARGSLLELETQELIAADLSYVASYVARDEADAIVARTQEVLRMLNGLMDSLERLGLIVLGANLKLETRNWKLIRVWAGR